MLKHTVALFALAGALAAQTPAPAPATAPKAAPAPSAGKPAAKPAAPQSRIDTVIEMVKSGMPEARIIKILQTENKPMTLTTDDQLKLFKGGVPDSIVGVLENPNATAGAATAPAAPAAAPTPAPQAEPVPAPVVVVVAQATPYPPDFAGAPAGPRKRRLAVDPFDYSAVKTWVTYWFQNDVNIGQGIRAMLTARMAQSKNITLVEREKLKNILAEQDLNNSSRVKQSTKAKTGNVSGADAMLFGDITIFGRDDKGKGARGGVAAPVNCSSFAGLATGVFGGGAFKKDDKAVVAIALRIVDAETSEVIETGEARGESKRSSINWGAMGSCYGRGAAVSGDMSSSNFEQTIIGEATSDAVTKVVDWLNLKIPKMPEKERAIDGRVTFAGGQTLLNVGANDGVLVGDRFEVGEITDEVRDPETKEVIDTATVKVGEFVVHAARDRTSSGEYGGQPIVQTKKYAVRLMTK